MAEQIDWSIMRGLLAADQEIEFFRAAILGKPFSSVERLTSRSQNAFRAEIGGVLTILRIVSHVSPAASERHANAFHRLARALHPERMSSPAVLTRFASTHSGVPADTDIVVTAHAPLTYVESDKADRWIVRRISGEQRQTGAILSYLAHLADHGLRRNFLFTTNKSGEFPFWFIDLDFSFGDTMHWGHGRPIFFPRGALSYQAAGYEAPPPPLAAKLVDWIEGLPRREAEQILRLSPQETYDLKTRCSNLKRLGLAGAIERERFWGPGDGFLTRWKETAYARITRSVAAWRSLRS